MVSKTIKSLDINLTKQATYLYDDDETTRCLQKNENLNKCRKPMFMNRKTQHKHTNCSQTD